MITHWTSALKKLDACPEAIAWAKTQPTYEEAWENCPWGDWLLWLADRTKSDHKSIVRAACACARTALKYVPEGENRPLRAIETTEAWCRGEATIEQVLTASHAAAAYAAHAAFGYSASASAASASASAASAAASANRAAAAAAATTNAAHAATYATHAATTNAAACAKLVRAHVTRPEL
jgi:hypothetical protein